MSQNLKKTPSLDLNTCKMFCFESYGRKKNPMKENNKLEL